MVEKDNRIERKKRFDKDWVEYIIGFEDNYFREEKWSICDRDLEAYYYGCDISIPIRNSEKIKIKRYRREDYKR